MKQYITIEQLNELSEKGKERLGKWWKPAMGNWYLWENPKDRAYHGQSIFQFQKNFDEVNSLPLLSIGQLIEFLDEKYDLSITFDKRNKSGYADLWHIDLIKKAENLAVKPELCDALWQAVKVILEK